MAIFTKPRLITVLMTIVVLALVWRYAPAREVVTGESSFLGIF